MRLERPAAFVAALVAAFLGSVVGCRGREDARRVDAACASAGACADADVAAVSKDAPRAAAPSTVDGPSATGSTTLTAGSAASAKPTPSDTAPPGATQSDAGKGHALTRYKSVLHVGDSMVGYRMGLQMELAKRFKDAGVVYESRTFTAAGIRSFATEKHVKKLVAEKNPDLVIVQIGTNNLTVPHPDVYLPDVRSILEQVGDRACIWIGPIPIDRPELGMRRVLRDNVGPCLFYDSYELDLARQYQDVHPTQAAAKKWSDAFWTFTENATIGRGRIADAGAPLLDARGP